MINGKKVVGIITEYNPFHAGHQYMIEQIRAEYHADYIVAAMSGDFVQRGEPAIFDKYERARDALLHGVDLVVQIPVMFSTSSAEDFAAGGVAVLRSLGFVDQLVFGSESADLAKLQQMAALELSTGSTAHAKFNAVVRDGLSANAGDLEAVTLPLHSFDILEAEHVVGLEFEALTKPALLHIASIAIGIGHRSALRRCNQGCRSVRRLRFHLVPALRCTEIVEHRLEGVIVVTAEDELHRFCPRLRITHVQEKPEELSCVEGRWNLTPESAVSQEVEEGSRATTAALSESPLRGIRGAAHQGYATLDMLSEMLSYRLLQLSYLDSVAPEANSVLCDYLDVSREIADALRKQVRERMSFRERIAAVKSRNYTYSRISRALLHILLDIPRKDHAALRGAYFGEAETMPYVRVLGVRQEAKELLSAITTTAVTSPARYQRSLDALRRQTIESPEDLLQSIRADHAELMFRSDLYAADLYRLIYHPYDGEACLENEFTRRFLIIE